MTETRFPPHETKVSVLGCGWMGLPIAERLLAEGYQVKGSATSSEKCVAIKQAGIEAFELRCLPHLVGEHSEAFFQSDILILTLPFRRSFTDPTEYRDQVHSILENAQKGSVRWVIFTSSTSAYSFTGGRVTEDDSIESSNPRQQVLLGVEKDILSGDRFEGTVLRFAGLYGGSRQLGNFIGRRAGPSRSPDHRVNLIHLDDCVGIMLSVIAQGATQQIFNAVSDEHPTRRELYTQKAIQLGKSVPEFETGTFGPDKVVSNEKLKRVLNYTFIHPNPLE